VRALLLLAVAGCGATPPGPPARTDARYGLVLHYEEDIAVAEFFRRNRCMVTAIRGATRDGDAWVVATWYPSVNHGGEEGRGETFHYPHEVRVTNPRRVPVDPSAATRDGRTLLVLRATPEPFVYELAGTAREAATPSLSRRWFEDKQDLHYRP
jgi:hypothetical protein